MAYSVPNEAEKLFRSGILENTLIKDDLPAGAAEAAANISFEGSDSPSLPINWRFAESISALKGYEAVVLSVLLTKKYGVGPVSVKINTDHAQLFIMSSFLWTIDPEGTPLTPMTSITPEGQQILAQYFPDRDIYKCSGSPYRTAVTNIYKTKDNKYFHLHGSLNPTPSLTFLHLPPEDPAQDYSAALAPIETAVAGLTASELQALADTHRQAGTICHTPSEYISSPHGLANAHTGLFQIHARPSSSQLPSWWPASKQTSPARPLAGLKVVDLTRIIAAPTISRGLAELGASVMRVTADHLPDMSMLHPDLNHGKWNCSLDLRAEGDREKLRALILDADVVVQGYRPGVMEKWGFGEEGILEICKGGERGVVVCEENCYGWEGEWMGRSGWQQISDACVGVSWEFGRAMGRDEPVTPVFPNSDYCTGVVGTAGVLTALIRQAEEGGSYVVKTALNYYNQWLITTCGAYPPDIWATLRGRFKHDFRHYHHMFYTLPRVIGGLYTNPETAGRLFRPQFFTQYHAKSIGKTMRIVAPVLQFSGGEVRPGFQVGTRGNGVDQPRWPDDLETEVVV